MRWAAWLRVSRCGLPPARRGDSQSHLHVCQVAPSLLPAGQVYQGRFILGGGMAWVEEPPQPHQTLPKLWSEGTPQTSFLHASPPHLDSDLPPGQHRPALPSCPLTGVPLITLRGQPCLTICFLEVSPKQDPYGG